MRICFPIEVDKGLDSVIFGHFGLAPLFMFVDTKAKTSQAVINQARHDRDKCSPLKILEENETDMVIVEEIGPEAIARLNANRITVYKAGKKTLRENIDLFRNHCLTELSVDHACLDHGTCEHQP